MIGRNRHCFIVLLCRAHIFIGFFGFNQLNLCTAQLFNTNLFLPQPATTGASSGLQFRHREVLNQTSGSILEWEVDRSANSISFSFSTNIANQSRNTLLLGLSTNGDILGADMVAITGIGDRSSGETVSFTDMHGSTNTTLSRDTLQNWRLQNFERNSSTITVTTSRLLDTCDEQDILINSDLLRFIWGFSDSQNTNGSIDFVPEGDARVYLTDPETAQSNESQLQSWRISRQYKIPPRRTSYWCTIHRGPQLPQKHHIVSYAPYFRDDTSRQHVHHQLVYRCTGPIGVDPALVFDRYVDHPGEECYLEDTHELPTVFCSEMVQVWAVGGKEFVLPNDVGLALGDTPNEYFMLETHYDNPENRADLTVVNGVDFQYTAALRPNEGSILFTGSGVMGLFQVPPQAANFTVAAHCSPECTKRMFPLSGVEVVATMLHAHTATRQVAFKRYRGNQELPWIQRDGNYDFGFQQTRLLPEPVTVLPGDQLITECVMNTTSRNETTLSGFATSDEMCLTFFIIKKRLPYFFCTSEYPTARTMQRYGVRNLTWTREGQERVVNVADNPEFDGLPLTRVIDQTVGNWTPERISEIEREQLYEEHRGICPNARLMVMAGYGFMFAERLTGGIIDGETIIQAQFPTIRSISTPPIFATPSIVEYPLTANTYFPLSNCTTT